MVGSESGSQKFLKSFDSYGKSIGLTLNNKDVHKTVLGGLVTLLIVALCITYACIVITNPLEAGTNVSTVTSTGNSTGVSTGTLLSSSDLGNGFEVNGYYQTKVSTRSMNFYNSSITYNLGNDGLMFAVRLSNNAFDITQVSAAYYDITGVNNQRNFTFLGAEFCTADHFPSSLVEELTQSGVIGTYICPNKTQLRLMNDFLHPDFIYLGLQLVYCTNDDSCQTSETIYNTYNGDFINLLIVDGHYDPDDYDDPIKYRLNFDYGKYLSLSGSDYADMRVQRNVVNMIDGSTRVFYKTVQVSLDVVDFSFVDFYAVNFFLNHEYIQYDQYIDYQISPTTRRLNSGDTAGNEEIMPSYYFAFYILAQFGGLYAFLHLVFGFFMNRWTEQHLKQAFVNELYSSIEIKNQLKAQAVNQQPEGYMGGRIAQDNVPINLGMNAFPNNEQYPLMNEQSVHRNNAVNLHGMNNQPNENYIHDESQLNDFDNQSFNPMQRRRKKKSPEFNFDYKDAFYGMFYCSGKEEEPDMLSLKGRQTLLNYQFDILTYQRDAITILDSLNMIRNEIQSIDKKFDNKIAMIDSRNSDISKIYQEKAQNLNQMPPEEQKFTSNEQHSQINTPVNSNVPAQFKKKSHDCSYKDQVRSINNIISEESKTFAPQKPPSFDKSKIVPEKRVLNEQIVYQEQPKDDSLSLELSQIQNQNYCEKSMKRDISNGYAVNNPNIELNQNIEPDQNNAQNQIVNESYFEMEFNKINGPHSQLWQ